MQNWQEQKVKQNVLDLPSGIIQSPKAKDIKKKHGRIYV
jgi:hypothetical protein